MPPIFVGARVLAERLGVSHDTVLTCVRRGKSPDVRDGRNRLLFNMNAVVKSLRKSPNPATQTARVREGGR